MKTGTRRNTYVHMLKSSTFLHPQRWKQTKYPPADEQVNQSVACPDDGILLSRTKIIVMALAKMAALGTGREKKPGRNRAIYTKEKKTHRNTREARH